MASALLYFQILILFQARLNIDLFISDISIHNFHPYIYQIILKKGLDIDKIASLYIVANCIWQINQDIKLGHKIPLIGNKLYSIYAISEFN